jgi:outer membrane lipoprotein-sorting protein
LLLQLNFKNQSLFTLEKQIMHKSISLLFLSILFCLFGQAQPEGYTIVTDTGYIRKKIEQVSMQTNSINTDFIQEKEMSFLNEKILSKGILLYQKPDKLRLEYTSPFTYLLIMNGGELFIKSKESEMNINLESSSMFSEINDLIINSIQGKVLDMPDMNTLFYENSETFFIRLLPKNQELQKYIKAIEMHISKKDFTVTEFKIIELSDDYTLIKFVNKKINEEIPGRHFNTH